MHSVEEGTFAKAHHVTTPLMGQAGPLLLRSVNKNVNLPLLTCRAAVKRRLACSRVRLCMALNWRRCV